MGGFLRKVVADLDCQIDSIEVKGFIPPARLSAMIETVGVWGASYLSRTTYYCTIDPVNSDSGQTIELCPLVAQILTTFLPLIWRT